VRRVSFPSGDRQFFDMRRSPPPAASRDGPGALVMTPGSFPSSALVRHRGMGKSLCNLLVGIWITFAMAIAGLVTVGLLLHLLS